MTYKTWLKNFENPKKQRDFFIVYQYIDNIQIYKTKYKKDGSFAKGTKIDRNKIVEFRYNSLLDEDDREIIKLLLSFESIEGSVGAFLLKKLLKTKRFLNSNWELFEYQKGDIYLTFDENIKINYPTVDLIFQTFPIFAKNDKTFFEFDEIIFP